MNIARLNQASFSFLLVGVILHIVCIALPHFAHVDRVLYQGEGPDLKRIPHSQIDFGLFKACCKNKTTESCVTMVANGGGDGTFCGASPPKDDEMSLIWQFISLIGLFFMACGLGLTGLSIWRESKGDRLRILPRFICALCWIGALIVVSGDIVFTVSYFDVFVSDERIGPDGQRIVIDWDPEPRDQIYGKSRLDWGFGLDIVACVLMALGGGIHIKISRLGSRGVDGIV